MPFFSHADDWDETESCRVKLKDSFAIEAKYCDDCDTDDIKFYVRGKKDNTIELKEDVIYLKKKVMAMAMAIVKVFYTVYGLPMTMSMVFLMKTKTI